MKGHRAPNPGRLHVPVLRDDGERVPLCHRPGAHRYAVDANDVTCKRCIDVLQATGRVPITAGIPRLDNDWRHR